MIETPEELNKRNPGFHERRLDREHFSPGIVPQDAIYGSKLAVMVGRRFSIQTLTSGALTVVGLDGIVYQRGNVVVDLVNSIITVNESGLYLVAGQVSMSSTAGATLSEVFIETAPPKTSFAGVGSNPRVFDALQTNSTGGSRPTGSGIFAASSGQQFRICVYNGGGGPPIIDYGDWYLYPLTWIALVKLSDFGKRLYTDIGTV